MTAAVRRTDNRGYVSSQRGHLRMVDSPSQPSDLTASRESIEKAVSAFRGHQYQRHNCRRQEHLASLNLELHGKSVLEVGAGIGDHTSFFLDRDCSVVSMEPRAENCEVFSATMHALQSAGYQRASRVQLVRGDIESLGGLIVERFDIVYCYGLLYHLVDPRCAIEAMAARCRGLLLLETCVSFGNREELNPIAEPQADPTQSFRGLGCRPTRTWVFNNLKLFFPFVYLPLTQPAHEEFPLDWTPPYSQQLLVRAVFIAAQQPINNDQLVEYLPDHQKSC
jgi:SAM-dependent methyltransferase